MDLHLVLPVIWLILRVTGVLSSKTLLDFALKENVSRVVLTILGGICGVIAVIFQWDDARWPTAQAKLRHLVSTGLSSVCDIALAIQQLGKDDGSTLAAWSPLLTGLASLLLTVNSIRLFAKGLATGAERKLTWRDYFHLASRRIPDTDVAWEPLPSEVKVRAIEKRNTWAYNGPSHPRPSEDSSGFDSDPPDPSGHSHPSGSSHPSAPSGGPSQRPSSHPHHADSSDGAPQPSSSVPRHSHISHGPSQPSVSAGGRVSPSADPSAEGSSDSGPVGGAHAGVVSTSKAAIGSSGVELRRSRRKRELPAEFAAGLSHN